jgi:hypothetical protein
MVVSYIDTIRNGFNCLVSGKLVLWFTRFSGRDLGFNVLSWFVPLYALGNTAEDITAMIWLK